MSYTLKKGLRTYSRAKPVCEPDEFDRLVAKREISASPFSEGDVSNSSALDDHQFQKTGGASGGNNSLREISNDSSVSSCYSASSGGSSMKDVAEVKRKKKGTRDYSLSTSSDNKGAANKERNKNGKNKENNKENELLSSSSLVDSDLQSSNEEKKKKKNRRGKNKRKYCKNESPATTSSAMSVPEVLVTHCHSNITQRKNKPNKKLLRPPANSQKSSVSSNGNESSEKPASIDSIAKSRQTNLSRKESTSDAGPDTSMTSSKLSDSINTSSNSNNVFSNASPGCVTTKAQTPLSKLGKKNIRRHSEYGRNSSYRFADVQKLSAQNIMNGNELQNTQSPSDPMTTNSNSPLNSSKNSSFPHNDSSALSLDTNSIIDLSHSIESMHLDSAKSGRKLSTVGMSTPNKTDDSPSDCPSISPPIGISPVLSSDELKVESSSPVVNDSSGSVEMGSKSVAVPRRTPPSIGAESTVNIAASPSVVGSSSLNSKTGSPLNINKSVKSHVNDFENGTSGDIGALSEARCEASRIPKKNEVPILRVKSKSKASQNENDPTINQNESVIAKPTSVVSNQQVLQPQSSILNEPVVESHQNASKLKVSNVQSQFPVRDKFVVGNTQSSIKFEEPVVQSKSPVCDKSLVINPRNAFKFKESVNTHGAAEIVFKKPLDGFKPAMKPPKKEAYSKFGTIHEDTVMESCLDPQTTVAGHLGMRIANKNDTLFGDITSMNLSVNYSIIGGNSLLLEPGKAWRRSFFKAKRKSQFFERSRIHDVTGIDRTKIHDDTIIEGPENYTVCHLKGVLTLDDILLDVSPKDYTLMRCGQTEFIPFGELFPDESLKDCTKLGEGVFGEVFLLGPSEGNSVIKIIPIEGNQLVNEERQKKFEEVLSEIITAQELSNLRYKSRNVTSGFNEILECKCVIGEYPVPLITQWNRYKIAKKSYNDSPDMFEKDQKYIVLKLGNAGKDLECFEFTSAFQSYSALLQIALSLAVAEASLEFEHRDLHWGNVLLAPTKEKAVTFHLNDIEYNIPTHGVIATIIDFTLSRVTFKNKEKNYIVYFNLGQDPELFDSEGDYQFEIYRKMKEEVQDEWCSFKPRNNVFWLHYIVDKMIEECHYKNPKGLAHKKYMLQLKEFSETILECSSCVDFVESYPEYYGKE